MIIALVEYLCSLVTLAFVLRWLGPGLLKILVLNERRLQATVDLYVGSSDVVEKYYANQRYRHRIQTCAAFPMGAISEFA